MTPMTKAQFKKRWDSDDTGGGITYDDVANCAKAWGVVAAPRTRPMEEVRDAVLRAAGCVVDVGYAKLSTLTIPRAHYDEVAALLKSRFKIIAAEGGALCSDVIEVRGCPVLLARSEP